MLLRARILLPITAPPIEDGAVLISGERIVEVGRWADLAARHGGPVEDLGEVVLMPGLVNAHCHLDYSRFAGHLPPPRSFTDWIKGVLALKAGWSFSEYAASWLDGARQLLAGGCSTVLDIEAVPELLPEAWSGTPLRVISALELTGVRSERPAAEIVAEAVGRGRSLVHDWNRVALSPHAPYSTRFELLTEAARTARREGWRLTIHVAESAEEFEMFRQASGPMHLWLRGQRGPEELGVRTPVGHVAAAGVLGPDCVVAHANCLEPGDIEELARTGTHVVHCPRSHAYFGHPPFPFEALTRAGVNVCLGTDSLLSVRKHGRRTPVLDLRAEMAEFADRHPEVSPEAVLSMTTRNAARALGLEGQVGVPELGALADWVSVAFAGSARGAVEAVIRSNTTVSAVMIGGRWVLGRDAEGTAGAGGGNA